MKVEQKYVVKAYVGAEKINIGQAWEKGDGMIRVKLELLPLTHVFFLFPCKQYQQPEFKKTF